MEVEQFLEDLKKGNMTSSMTSSLTSPGDSGVHSDSEVSSSCMTKSDIDNRNVPGDDLMTVSLNSYELLDYTQENSMHVSVSEEVSENPLKTEYDDEQIVYRRHRKKKTETPKKRVSFHEDILNNTRVDDVHIDHGFVTLEPIGFFGNGMMRKADVVQGRYSWAAEGDSPFYQVKEARREVHSDVYVHRPRFSSSSSSSSVCSSVEDEIVKREPVKSGVPKSSCLKKSKRCKRFIDTHIVEEERPPETNLLDAKIFGSLKNMFGFASNTLAERGVPEGQEDVPKVETPKPDLKSSLKLSFYPNYHPDQNLPPNVIVCASNVYEHKGISYSYEYENFKKTFETQSKSKSSTLYQTLLNELNFFKSKETAVATTTDPSVLKLQEIQSDLIDIRQSETTPSPTKHLSSPKRKVQSQILIKQASSKASLINRFLRSVTAKKVADVKMKKCKRNGCYVGLLARVKVEDNKNVDEEIVKEVAKKKKAKEFDVHLLYRFKHEVFRSFSEELVMVFPATSAYTTSGETKTIMVVLTDSTLYITGYKHNNTYCNHFVLPYTELNTVLIGPNAQTIHFANYDNDMQCVITTGDESLTNELMAQLEIAMRRDGNKPKLPAVKQLCMTDMVNLRRVICRQTPIEKDAEYYHYSVVNLLDQSDDETPLGPTKEGPLMYKTTDATTRWESAYFILKAGILYLLSSPTHRLPIRVLPLINGACQGARRVYNLSRPHTFQVKITGTTLFLAAPNEYVASEWLQTLIHAASKTYVHKETASAHSCSLLMTGDHIVLVREAFPCMFSSTLSLNEQHRPIKGAQILSCAAIADIVAFKLPCAEQSWCILEFACREVLENSGDWIVYFTTNAELERFISSLEMLWGYHNEQECFPISTLPETDPLSKKCVETYKTLRNTWLTLQIDLEMY